MQLLHAVFCNVKLELSAFTYFVSTVFKNKSQADAIYFDFSIAFDRVPHDPAVTNLRHLSFLRWITDYGCSPIWPNAKHLLASTARNRVTIPSLPASLKSVSYDH